MTRLLAFTFLVLFSTQLLPAQNNLRFMADNRLFPPKFLKKNRIGVTPVLKHVRFHPGDTIVDIGAGNGWFSCAIAMHHDSLTFYLEDIDSSVLNPERLAMAVQHYTQQKGKALTSRFLPVAGTEMHIPLPDQSVHKILLIDTYHHFTHRPEMLQEMHRILKKDGQLLIVEVLARKMGDIHPGCHSQLYLQPMLLKDFAENKFRLTNNARAGKDFRRKKRLFVFAKK